jgi:hypothetical protein
MAASTMASLPIPKNEVRPVATRRLSGLVLVFFTVVLLAGCQSSGTASEPTSAAPDPTTASSTAESTASACADVTAKGLALGTAATQFLDGSATADQVRTAADDLSEALTAAGANAQANLTAALDDAQAALDTLLTALQAQPVDRAGLRTASTDVLAALSDAAALCEPAPTS